MSCERVARCPLFPHLNASLAGWREAYCDSESGWNDCARLKLALSGQKVPLALLPNGRTPAAMLSLDLQGAEAPMPAGSDVGTSSAPSHQPGPPAGPQYTGQQPAVPSYEQPSYEQPSYEQPRYADPQATGSLFSQQPYPGQQSYTGQQPAVPPYGQQPYTGQQSYTGQQPAVPPYGQQPQGDASYGTAQPRESAFGQPSYGQPRYADPQGAGSSFGQQPYGQQPYGQQQYASPEPPAQPADDRYDTGQLYPRSFRAGDQQDFAGHSWQAQPRQGQRSGFWTRLLRRRRSHW